MLKIRGGYMYQLGQMLLSATAKLLLLPLKLETMYMYMQTGLDMQKPIRKNAFGSTNHNNQFMIKMQNEVSFMWVLKHTEWQKWN